MSEEAEIRMRKRISTKELERRWKLLRGAMKEKNLDFIIVQNDNAHFPGYVSWLTDLAVSPGYPLTVIFPRDEEMTLIAHGARLPAPPSPPAWLVRGVKKRLSVPTIQALDYSCVFNAELAVAELAAYKNSRIGIAGMGTMSAAFYKYLTGHLSSARFEDATDMIDNLKVIKSDEEIDLIREACRQEDELFEFALTCIRPGRRDYEIRADIMHKGMEIACDEFNVMVGSAPAGTAARLLPARLGNRVIQEGDQVSMLLETSGPSGLWGEFARIICLGKVPDELQECYELAKKAQKVTLDMLKPGADPVAIFEANNKFLRSIGYPEERRIYAHGQGYDMVERPSMNPGETMKIQARMNIAVHPEVASPRAFGWVCENYLVKERGEPECLQMTPQKIFTV